MKEFLKPWQWKEFFALSRLPFLFLGLTFVLLPIFFIPSGFFSFEFNKSILLGVGVFISFILYIINALKSGNVVVPLNKTFLALFAILVVYLISSLAENFRGVSLVGYGFEGGTFVAIFLLVLFATLSATLFDSQKKLFTLYSIFFAISVILALFHISRLFFGADFLSLGFFPNLISNTVGKWNELAIFFGVSAILSLFALDILRLRSRLNFLFLASLLLSLGMLIVINFPLAWYVVALASITLFVYLLSFDGAQSSTLNVVSTAADEGIRMKSGRRISFKSLAVVIIALIFTFTPVGADIGDKINQRFGVQNIDVRPSWSATFQISQNTFKAEPLLGVGPNKFSQAWQLYRPEVNLTNFWNVNFSHGVGFVPTSVIETGILGALAWLAFFVFFVLVGVRAFFSKGTDRLSRFFKTSSFTAALFLWIMNIIYMPSLPILALTFFFTGICVAFTDQEKTFGPRSFSFFRFPKMSFVVVLVLVFFLVVALALGYSLIQKTAASYFFVKGTSLPATSENLETALGYVLKAERVSANDTFYRSIAELNIIKLNRIIREAAGGAAVSPSVQSEFQNTFDQALGAAGRAQAYNSDNYENWFSVGRAFESIMPVDATSAYERAKEAYSQALSRSPRNPLIYLSLARLDASARNFNDARENANRALELKPNYLDAVFFLSQVDIAEGKIGEAINSIERSLPAFPGEPNVYFHLGVLKYEIKDYRGAAQAFEQAVTFVPIYANARYFLGLSYERLNRKTDAIAQFEELAKTNPGNQDVENILKNLRAGKSALSNIVSEEDSEAPEKKTLPVEENN